MGGWLQACAFPTTEGTATHIATMDLSRFGNLPNTVSTELNGLQPHAAFLGEKRDGLRMQKIA